jgi:hypothetical protein
MFTRSFLSSQIEGLLLHGTHVVAYSILSPPKQYLPQQLKLAPQPDFPRLFGRHDCQSPLAVTTGGAGSRPFSPNLLCRAITGSIAGPGEEKYRVPRRGTPRQSRSTAVRSRPARALVRAVLQVAGPTVTPAPLPLAWQAGRRQFGLGRGHRQRWKLETL